MRRFACVAVLALAMSFTVLFFALTSGPGRQTRQEERLARISAAEQEYVVKVAWRLLSDQDRLNVCRGVRTDGADEAAWQILGEDASPARVEPLADLLKEECP